MRNFIYFILLSLLVTLCISGCKMAPSDNNGDTVAAAVFTPAGIPTHLSRTIKKGQTAQDSTNIFIIGKKSDHHNLQLVTYPTRKDTLIFVRARHLKVQGNADFGHIVKVKFYITGKDTLVSEIKEFKTRKE